MTTQETIDFIIQQMAMGWVCCDEAGYECIYCRESDGAWNVYAIDVQGYREKVKHKADCPILLARKVLREQGTPIKVYLLSAEQLVMSTPSGRELWSKVTDHTLAISEDAARRIWSSLPRLRNITAEYVADLPEYEEQP